MAFKILNFKEPFKNILLNTSQNKIIPLLFLFIYLIDYYSCITNKSYQISLFFLYDFKTNKILQFYLFWFKIINSSLFWDYHTFLFFVSNSAIFIWRIYSLIIILKILSHNEQRSRYCRSYCFDSRQHFLRSRFKEDWCLRTMEINFRNPLRCLRINVQKIDLRKEPFSHWITQCR